MSTLFTIDEQAIKLGATPVENQFILEYLPGAKGEYVKVYLYGLFYAVHPQLKKSLEEMAQELGLEDADVIHAAYRYWERKGLVVRTSDNPLSWKYVSVNQHALMGVKPMADSDYDSFCEAIYHLFGSARDLEAKELSRAYEWKMDLGLSTEIVLMLIQYMISMRGTNFSFRAAEKVAMTLSDENASTIEDAEKVLSREKRIYDGSKKILRRFEKGRNPTVDEQALYRKWTDTWGYSHDAIEAACAETTKGEPTFGYLDGILAGMLRRNGKALSSAGEVEKKRQQDQDRRAPLRALLDAMGLRSVTINDGTLAVYDGFRELYPDEIILIAGQECAKTSGADLTTVDKMLSSWKNRGLQTKEEIIAYINLVNDLNAKLRDLSYLLGTRYVAGAEQRNMLDRWLNTWHLSWEYIITRAAEAKFASNPLSYLNALLDPEKSKPADAAPVRSGAKTVTEQQYEQRTYTDDDEDVPDWLRQQLEDMKKNEN